MKCSKVRVEVGSLLMRGHAVEGSAYMYIDEMTRKKGPGQRLRLGDLGYISCVLSLSVADRTRSGNRLELARLGTGLNTQVSCQGCFQEVQTVTVEGQTSLFVTLASYAYSEASSVQL